jgi:AraC-like DNA-binding protein/mannose-6-phosphate isomerase-like protein (cupin superfamily)
MKNVHNSMMMNTPWKPMVDRLEGFSVERAYHYTCRDPLFGKLHRHDRRFHIAYILTGKCRITVVGKPFDVGPRDAVFIRPLEDHCSIDDTKTYYELIEIHFLAHTPADARTVPSIRPVVHVHNIAAVVPALERLVAAHLIDTSSGNWLTKVRLAETLMLLEKEGGPQTVADMVSGDTERKIRQATEYIALNYARNLTIASLADLVGMSPSHFAACFKRITRISPIEFVIRRRLDHARELLQNSNFSIGQIADMCGFASSQYFARIFTRREGSSPRQARRKR